MADLGFRLLSTFRYDLNAEMLNPTTGGCTKSRLYLLEFHHARLMRAAKHFGVPIPNDLSSPTAFEAWLLTFCCPVGQPMAETLRLRVTLDGLGHIALTTQPTPPLHPLSLFPPSLNALVPRCKVGDAHSARADVADVQRAWDVFVAESAVAATEHTHFKTTMREVYDNARAGRPLIGAEDRMQEVLLFDEKGLITEGSLTTPYFLREGAWTTPRVQDKPKYAGGQSGTTRLWALRRGLCVEGDVQRAGLKDGEIVVLSNSVRGFGWGRLSM